MNTNYLPHYIAGFITGLVIGFAALMEYIMQTREPADLPHRCDAGDAAHSPTEPEPVEFDTRMSNEEWIDAVLTEALRKANK